MKILAITGIRSEYDILYPVLDEMRNAGHDVSVVVSGAHLSQMHGYTVEHIENDGFDIADRIDTLFCTERTTQRPKAVAMLIAGLTQTVEKYNPDFLIVVGDREESIAAAVVSNYMDKLLVHIGGGDPVFGNADDPVRFAVSKLAHLHCCIGNVYADNLIKIGEEDFRVFWTGNPSYVNIASVPDLSINELSDHLGIDLADKPYVVMIKHSLSSEAYEAFHQMEISMKALEMFCAGNNYQCIVIPPNTDPGSEEIRKVIKKYSDNKFIHVLDTLPRLEFINLIRKSQALVGNSSMGILEAPFYKLPVVNIGNRQQGRLNAGNVEFVKHDVENIIQAMNKACLNKDYRNEVALLENPYGDASAARKVREAIESVDLNDSRWYVKQRLC